MALSRFYKPTNYEYMSQFVPKNLEIMDRGLQRAQAKQDKQVGKLDELSGMLLKQKALPEFDTKVRDQIVGEVKSFSEEMANTDLTNPENFRKVNQFVQQYANDERINKLNLGLASKAKYDKIKEDLVTKGEYATENDRVFMKEYERYLTQPDEGAKFAIDYIGGKELIEKDAPSAPKLKEMINEKVGSSYVYDSVKGTWKHKTTREALTDKELREIMKLNAKPFLGTTAGKQLARRAEMRMEQDPNWSLEKQYWLEADPIIAEKTYSKNKDEFTDISQNLLNKKKLEDETAVALVQKGKTAALFGTFKNIDDINSEIETLKTSDNPADKYKAAQMEAQKELLNNNFSKNLSKKEQDVLKFENVPLSEEIKFLENINSKLEYPQKRQSDQTDQQYKNSLLMRINQDRGITKGVESSAELFAEANGLDYGDLKKRRDSYIAKGEIFEANDIILTASKGSSDARKRIAEQAKTAFNDINLNVLRTTKEDVSVDETINTMDQQSIKITDGLNGPEISYRYKDDEGKYQYITVASKDLGQGLQETTDELYQNLSGGDPMIYTQLVNSHRYSNLKPVSKNSDFNQKELIIQHLPQEEATILNKASDVKIIQNNNGTVSIIAKRKDKSGIEQDLYNVTAPTVPQAMKLLEIQL